MGLPDSVRLKLNGTFKRDLFLLNNNDCMFRVVYRIQTALWYDDQAEKWQYVSIFPSFIKRYCQPSINMLEYISCKTGKGESIFEHIDDPEEILESEDRLIWLLRKLERESNRTSSPALLNSRYTEVYNKPLTITADADAFTRRFPMLYLLVLTARQYFGQQQCVLSLVNTMIRL